MAVAVADCRSHYPDRVKTSFLWGASESFGSIAPLWLGAFGEPRAASGVGAGGRAGGQAGFRFGSHWSASILMIEGCIYFRFTHSFSIIF